MTYLYQNHCFDTVEQLHNSVAADCPAVSNGFAFNCTPSATDITIRKTDISTGIYDDLVYIPAQIACDVSYTDLTQLLWDTSLIWVSAFTFAIIAKRLIK